MYHFVKTLHLLGVGLLAFVLLGQAFLNRFSETEQEQKILQALRQNIQYIFYAALVLLITSGFYLGFSFGLFDSADDLWLYYKLGLTLLFILLLMWAQGGSKKMTSFRRKKWTWWFIFLLYCSLLYIPVAKPHFFNKPLILLETIDSPSDTEEVEEIEEVEEVEEIEEIEETEDVK